MVLVVKNPSAYEEDIRDCGFNSWVGKIPWRRAWQPPLQYSCLENPLVRGASELQSIGLQRIGYTEAT